MRTLCQRNCHCDNMLDQIDQKHRSEVHLFAAALSHEHEVKSIVESTAQLITDLCCNHCSEHDDYLKTRGKVLFRLSEEWDVGRQRLVCKLDFECLVTCVKGADFVQHHVAEHVLGAQ